MHIHILHALNRVIQSIIQPINQKHVREQHVPTPVSLKPWALAQAKEAFRSSYRLLLRWDYQQEAQGPSASSCLGGTSSPKQDCSWLKAKISRLSDNSHRAPTKFPRILA